MAFEHRKTSAARYLFIAFRDRTTGKVRKKYYGRGPEADAAAAALADRKKQREAERHALATGRAELRVVDALMHDLDGGASALMEAALLAAGYHRENYGPWQLRRRLKHGHGRQAGRHSGTAPARCND